MILSYTTAGFLIVIFQFILDPKIFYIKMSGSSTAGSLGVLFQFNSTRIVLIKDAAIYGISLVFEEFH